MSVPIGTPGWEASRAEAVIFDHSNLTLDLPARQHQKGMNNGKEERMEGEHQPGAGPETTGNQQQREQQHERSEALHEETPRIYVASLSDYNNGVLHGEWIDADQDADELHRAAAAMLARSPTDPRAEEFAVHDYDNFGVCRIGEYDSLEWVSAVARGIGEHGLAFAAWAEQCDAGADRLAKFEDAYRGEWNSLTEYAEELLDDFGLNGIIEQHVPESLQPFVTIDAESFGNNLVLGGDIALVSHDDGVWVFEGMI